MDEALDCEPEPAAWNKPAAVEVAAVTVDIA
jgi:hypothetical protein